MEVGAATSYNAEQNRRHATQLNASRALAHCECRDHKSDGALHMQHAAVCGAKWVVEICAFMWECRRECVCVYICVQPTDCSHARGTCGHISATSHVTCRESHAERNANSAWSTWRVQIGADVCGAHIAHHTHTRTHAASATMCRGDTGTHTFSRW